jgi:hypothetical protein
LIFMGSMLVPQQLIEELAAPAAAVTMPDACYRG